MQGRGILQAKGGKSRPLQLTALTHVVRRNEETTWRLAPQYC
jgi:hypothetical protein